MAALLAGRGRRLFLGAVIAAVAIVGGAQLWRHVRSQVLSEPEYRLTADRIEVSPTPAWIKSDIKLEALRQSGLDREQSILESDLAERIAKAFELHPWVRRVRRVEKRTPAGVIVDLEYRRPTCMVEVPNGLYPVDAEGVLLPTADFTPEEALVYPRVAGVVAVTEGPVGTPWRDPRVEGACAIAELLGNDWSRLWLYRITPAARVDSSGEIEFEIETREGGQIVWGRAPGREPAEEPKAEEKRDRLLRLFADATGSQTAGEGEIIDLRRRDDEPRPRTAAKP